MILHYDCQAAVEECLENRRFAIARLRPEEKTFDLHLHNLHEIYFSIAGAKKFLIESESYPVEPGDVFFVKQFESHCVTQLDEVSHERISISVHPEFIQRFSTPATDLSLCFENKEGHRLSLDKDAQTTFQFFIQKLSAASGYGQDLQETATFIELLLFLNQKMLEAQNADEKKTVFVYDEKAAEVLDYINRHLADDLTLDGIAARFYMSKSYLCRIFNQFTGTTINKYISARRISVAKNLLHTGESAMDACKLSGFNDYSNFHRAFTRTLGVTPKKYQTLSMQHALNHEAHYDFASANG